MLIHWLSSSANKSSAFTLKLIFLVQYYILCRLYSPKNINHPFEIDVKRYLKRAKQKHENGIQVKAVKESNKKIIGMHQLWIHKHSNIKMMRVGQVHEQIVIYYE